jgi:hypothetical protein
LSLENVEIVRMSIEAFNAEGLPGIERVGSADHWHTDPLVPEPGEPSSR